MTGQRRRYRNYINRRENNGTFWPPHPGRYRTSSGRLLDVHPGGRVELEGVHAHLRTPTVAARVAAQRVEVSTVPLEVVRQRLTIAHNHANAQAAERTLRMMSSEDELRNLIVSVYNQLDSGITNAIDAMHDEFEPHASLGRFLLSRTLAEDLGGLAAGVAGETSLTDCIAIIREILTKIAEEYNTLLRRRSEWLRDRQEHTLFTELRNMLPGRTFLEVPHENIITGLSDSALNELCAKEKLGTIECAVCLCTEKDVMVVELFCKHTFHTACIRPWLAQNDKCPMCRRQAVTGAAEAAPHSEVFEFPSGTPPSYSPTTPISPTQRYRNPSPPDDIVWEAEFDAVYYPHGL